MHSTNRQIESIINWRMRTYQKEKAVKSLKKILHSKEKETESIINWRVRTYEKEKAVKSAEHFFTQHRRTN